MNLKLKSALISVTAVIAVSLSVMASAAGGGVKDVTEKSSLNIEEATGIEATTGKEDSSSKYEDVSVKPAEKETEKSDKPVIIKHDVMMGDTDKDGKVTAADARLALRASGKLEELDLFATIAGDINNDREVTAIDARSILRVAARLDTFDRLHHHSVEESPEAPASCTEDGKTSTVYCATCSMIFKEHEIIPAGHKIVRSEVPPTCTEPGYTYVDKCERCGEIIAKGDEIPAKGHTPAEDGAHCKDCGELYNPSKAITDFANGDFEFTGKQFTRVAAKDEKEITVQPDDDSVIKMYMKDLNMKMLIETTETSVGLTTLKTPYSYRSYLYSDDLGISTRYGETLIRVLKEHPNLHMILLDDDENNDFTLTKTVFNGKEVTAYKTVTTRGTSIIYVDGDTLIAFEDSTAKNPDVFTGFIIDEFKTGTADITYNPDDYKEVGNKTFLLAMSGYLDFQYIDIVDFIEKLF